MKAVGDKCLFQSEYRGKVGENSALFYVKGRSSKSTVAKIDTSSYMWSILEECVKKRNPTSASVTLSLGARNIDRNDAEVEQDYYSSMKDNVAGELS